jgi:hypothetical protein
MFLAGVGTKGFISSLLIGTVALVLIAKNGFHVRPAVLLGGALMSIMSVFAYGCLIIRDANAGAVRKGIIPMLFSLSGFIPYAFGCYLALYEGLWSLTQLINSFSFAIIGASFFYLIMGYFIVLTIYNLSEFERAISEGRIVITKDLDKLYSTS